MDNTKIRIPKGALVLATGGTGEVAFAQDDSKTPKLNMVIYSGGIIKGHWWWDDLVLDLSGAKFPKKKYPILQDHITSLKIGFHNGKPIVDKNLRFDPDKVVFVSTPESEEFRTVSSEGFPYEASARVRPHNIERIKAGSFGEANGIKLKGPGTIFRLWDFVEGSVCTFGYDRNTESSVFSDRQEIEIPCQWEGDLSSQETIIIQEDSIMDLTELKEKHPKLYAKAIEEGFTQGEAAAEAKFNEETEGGQGKFVALVDGLTKTVTDLAASVKEQGKQLLQFEKKEDIRAENELARDANDIWNAELSKSSIREERFSKIKKHVSYKEFVTDGRLDTEKFTEAVVKEIQEWEGLEGHDSQLLGTSFTSRKEAQLNADKEAQQDKEDDDAVDEMLSLANDPAAKEKEAA